MKKMTILAILLICGFLSAEDTRAPQSIAEAFDVDRMRADLKFLADDLLEGRGTGARGGQLAASYIAAEFAKAGLKPLGDKGTYLQKVPLIGLNTQPETQLSIFADGKAHPMKYLDDFVANALSLKSEETIDSPLVFVGYGIVAPEFHWNDYAGMDMKGKVAIALVNDPPSQDPKFFGGKAMTYYGRWTYKYEEAARQGAAGILLIHTTESASYSWNVVRNSNSGEQAYLELTPGAPALSMAGWITEDLAKQLASWSNDDLAKWFDKAKNPGFKAFTLPLHIRGKLIAKVRPLESHNIIGVLEGAKLRKEAVIFTAHYDHLGIGVPVNGDSIYNGAEDNASGTSLLLELARVFAQSKVKPARSIVFLSVTAEERGLRGSEYYGKHPAIPASDTMLDINYDGLSLWGETANVTVTGADRTSIWETVKRAAAETGFRIDPENHPEAGYYYRSDHFSLARVGIPAFSIDPGNEYVGKSREFGEQKYDEYLKKHYHQPSDEYNPEWDFSGAKKLARLGILIAWDVAQMPEKTTWRSGDEFEKVRSHH